MNEKERDMISVGMMGATLSVPAMILTFFMGTPGQHLASIIVLCIFVALIRKGISEMKERVYDWTGRKETA